MLGRLSQVTEKALHTLLPIQCVSCGVEPDVICSACSRDLTRLEKPYCSVCARPSVNPLCGDCQRGSLQVDGIRAPYLMRGPIREAIHQLKYRFVRAAAPALGRLLADYYVSSSIPAEIVVPVPLHPRRLRQRGYNQSALLARELGSHTGLPVVEGLLSRTRNTPPQVGLSLEERVLNMLDSFSCEGDVSGRAVLLIDDVATTGSTLSACAHPQSSWRPLGLGPGAGQRCVNRVCVPSGTLPQRLANETRAEACLMGRPGPRHTPAEKGWPQHSPF